MPIVSVIIPTYNRAYVLERALNSVAAQSFTDWELLIVDDGSTDNTFDLVERWRERQPDPNRVHLHTTENRGVSAARNLAARIARAEWLAFLDSDDEWLPHKLNQLMKLTPSFSLIHSEEIWIRNGRRVNPKKKHLKSGGRIFNRCVDTCCISPSTTMVNRARFLECGGFREDFPVCEDYELWLRWCSREDTGFVAEPLIMKHGGNEDQLSLTYRMMDYYRVKALHPFLNDETLSENERAHVAQTILQKCEILINGFHKHQNFLHLQEVESYFEDARKAFTPSQMAHSAADLRPRSVETPNL